jgi:hypothetical protein
LLLLTTWHYFLWNLTSQSPGVQHQGEGSEATFTYGGGSSEIAEELYSASAEKLSGGIEQIFDAMTGCPTYQVIAGGTPIDMTSQSSPHPTISVTNTGASS